MMPQKIKQQQNSLKSEKSNSSNIESLITDNIDIWTSAIKKKSITGRGSSKKIELYGIKKLRELILELAVRGKLVAQDPNDEPASVLLERIAVERAQLVKNEKLKKQKSLPEIRENEKPFELPQSWAWVRLNEVVDYNGRPNIVPMNIENDSWLLDLEDIEKDTSKIVYRATYSERDSKSNKSTFQKGDVLYGKLRPYLNKVIVADTDGVCTTEIVAIVPGEAICAEYLKFLLKSPNFLNYVNSLMYGVKMPRLGTEDAIKSIHSLPPLEEQHRIVAKVDELMLLCDQLEQQTESSIDAHKTLVEVLLTTLTGSKNADELNKNWARVSEFFDTLFTTEHSIDQLKQTILQLAVMGKLVPQNKNDEPAAKLLERIAAEKAQLIADKKIKKQKDLPPITEEEKPFELPGGWELVRFGECVVISSGNSFTKSEELDEGKYIYCKVGDMNLRGNETSITTSNFFINPNEKQLNSLIQTGSIIFPKRGGAIATNKKKYVKNDIFADSNVMAVRPFSDVLLEYVMLWLSSFDLASLNTGTSVPQINNKDIEPLKFIIPPLEEQRHIVAKVEQLMTICDQLKSRLNESQQSQLHLADALVEQSVL